MVAGVRRYGTKYQVINHKIYRDANCMFPSRCSGVEFFLRANLAKIPDLEMIVNSRDWPQINIMNVSGCWCIGSVFLGFMPTSTHVIAVFFSIFRRV